MPTIALFLLTLIAFGADRLAQADAPQAPRFEIHQQTFLMDEPIPIVISGLPPGHTATVRLRGGEYLGQWASSARFTVGPDGVVDVGRMASTGGDYQGVDAMGLFSTEMSEQVMARLRRNQFPYAYKHLSYDGAGHAIGRPYTSTMDLSNARHPLTGQLMHLGGTPEGTAHAREDSWRQTLAFLDEQLRHGPP